MELLSTFTYSCAILTNHKKIVMKLKIRQGPESQLVLHKFSSSQLMGHGCSDQWHVLLMERDLGTQFKLGAAEPSGKLQ